MSLLIVGGGATGLAAAYIAAKRGEQVTLIEASYRLGGLLSTFEVGGTHLEYFYHHFFTHDREILWLLDELGLSESIKFEETQMGIYRQGKLYPFGTTLDLLKFPHLSFLDKVRFGLTSLFLSYQKHWQNYENVPALPWFYRWAGKRATNVIWKPMLEIKFGEYADRIPVAWMIGRMQQRLRSRSQGQEKLGYLVGSLQRLVDALEQRLENLGVKIIKNAPIDGFQWDEAGRVIGVNTAQGSFLADQTLVTIPTVYFARLLPEAYVEYRHQLEQIEYFGAICAVVITEKPISSMYWINIADPGFEFGGVIEQTNFIPADEYQGLHITYLSRYMTQNHPLFHQPEQSVAQQFRYQLASIFPDLEDCGVRAIKVFRSSTAAMVCDLNFSQKIPAYKSPIPNLFVANMAHIYPDERSVNNSIKVAFQVDNVLQQAIESCH